MKKGHLFIISGSSGSGKTSIVSTVIPDLSSQYTIERVVTYTTKTPRYNEVHGVDYHFITEEDFKSKIEQGFFLEWSNDYGHYYGSPSSIQKGIESGASYILIADRTGAQSILSYAHIPKTLIWVYVEVEQLATRLTSRNADSLSSIERRLALAKKEIELEQEHTIFEHHIHNIVFDDAVATIKTLMVSILEK